MTKRVLITGGCGFLGAHVIEHILNNTNWEIISLGSINYAGALSRLTDIKSFSPYRVKFAFHDLRAPFRQAICHEIGEVDYIIHLAAETHVDRSLVDCIPFVMSNVLGTANLLEYIWHVQPHAKTLIMSTDEIFGPAPEGVFFTEDDRGRPSNPYAATKLGAEALAYSFAHAYELPISIVRAMNLIGERQHPEKFVPKVIKAIVRGNKVPLHGKDANCLASRCWLHCRNVASALLLLLDRAIPQEYYHVVGEERTVLEMANWISEAINNRMLREDEIEYVDFHKARKGHDKRYALSGEKLDKLGWKPSVNLETSLKNTVKWTLANKKWLFLNDYKVKF